MNAPWTPGRNTVRDPFNAYVCDDASLETLRAIALELGWPQEKIHKGGLRNAVQSLSVSASPSILFVDLSESGDPINDINALAEVCEPGTVVLACGLVNDVRLYRDLIVSGIQDYLLKPLSPDQLRDAVAHAQAVFSTPKHNDGVLERPHLMTAVIGARGGVGASTIATSLAWLFGDSANRTTALLDLDVHFGTSALALDLEPGRGLTDAIENPSRIDGLFIERAMVKANEKLSILSAEAPLHQAMLTDGGAFFQLQEEMRATYECTVIDLPRSIMVQHPHLLHETHATMIVTELTLAAARDVIRIQSWLRTNAPQSKIIIVANRVLPGATEVSRKDFESSIERKIDYLIPMDQKAASHAAKLGKSVAEAGKNTKVSTIIRELADHLLNSADSQEGDNSKASPKGKSLLGKLGDFTSLMQKKTPK